ncbi:lytic transglycosylase [Pseudoxanthomonas kalamensis DSM 18571]|nr:lytic transglycosylase [Pseudoxanthomonas kalamensis DSM 18571]
MAWPAAAAAPPKAADPAIEAAAPADPVTATDGSGSVAASDPAPNDDTPAAAATTDTGTAANAPAAPETPLPAVPPIDLASLPLPALPPIRLDSLPPPTVRNGVDIYRQFREGLADPVCDEAATRDRWKRHFGHAPGRLAEDGDDLLPLFGYVVEQFREAGLPTEYALIPFIESGYKPSARSNSGPLGMWQFIVSTARNHGVQIRPGYDGRLSPVESTRAATSYLKTLHKMFGRDWRLAIMGYNAGEYRILQSMRRAGVNSANADPAKLPGLSPITYAYVEKLHALACILEQAEDRDDWLRQLDRSVPRLAAQPLPAGASLDDWARRQGHDPAWLKRLNPALTKPVRRNGKPLLVLAPAGPGGTVVAAAPELGEAQPATASTATDDSTPRPSSYVVRRGDSPWTIARRHGLSVKQLLALNGLPANAVLRPGQVLKLDAAPVP